jgi:asparagine synthase (glutamine-hydrolysing)
MSCIAGIVSVSGRPLELREVEETVRLLPATDGVSRYENPFVAIFQIDIGAFGEPGIVSDARGVTAVAGHPFLPGDWMEQSADECRGVRRLHEVDHEEFVRLAASSTGSWAGVRYRQEERSVALCSDRVGARPLYWWSDGSVLVFSSLLGMLERHSLIPLSLDLQAVIEDATLGYPLADRTPFRDVYRIQPAEIVCAQAGGVRRSQYFRWADLPSRPVDDPAREHEVLDALRAAIARRNGARREAVTLLSGGLDSRVINAILHELGVTIHSFNFSFEGTQDAIFAREFARAINANHFEGEPAPGVGPGWVHLSGRVWDSMNSDSGVPLRELFPVWSGDYGSATAGWVGLTPSLVANMRHGRVDAAVEEHIRSYASLGAADLTPAAREWVMSAVPRAVVEEIARHESDDPARQFMFFLLSNTKRRHMDNIYEEILEHRTEFWTPFIDSAFLEAAMSVPADEGLGHGFYMRWFELLRPVVKAVPWQTYPGHVPCPLPVPPNLKAQWDAQVKLVSKRHRSEGSRPWSALLRGFPAPLFKRHRFIARVLLHQLRLKDSYAALALLIRIRRHWKRTECRPLPWTNLDAGTEVVLSKCVPGRGPLNRTHDRPL